MGHPFGGLLLSCSTKETEIRRRWVEARTAGETLEVLYNSKPELLDTYDEGKATRLIRKLAKNKTWQCPTFIAFRNFLFDARPSNLNDRVAAAQWEESRKKDTLFFQKNLELAGKMKQSGVPFLAGTDVPDPGPSLHDELKLLVEAGFSPIEALRTATLNPAIFLGKEKEFGTVKKGKVADLVLLDADPLVNINNTRRIAGVVVNGRYLSKESLQKIVKDARAVLK